MVKCVAAREGSEPIGSIIFPDGETRPGECAVASGVNGLGKLYSP